MEAPEELCSKEQTHIVKGKRTKRQRPQSPIPFSITAHSSSGDGDNNYGEKLYKDENYNSNSSPTTCSNEFHDSKDEDEDLANCLILLAQGQSRESPKQVEEHNVPMNYNKFNSRKFMETTASRSGKAGYYVYACKTCNRTFPSFQALGGHRASHKKPKGAVAMAAMVDHVKKQFLLLSDEEESQFKNTHNRNNNGYPLSLQLTSRGNLYNNNNRAKVHECSVCGAEFTSGQALGGHMRRHRAPIGTNSSATLSLTPMALEHDDQDQPEKQKNLLSLELDLNLPAPEDDHRESKFSFASKQQQQQQQNQQQQPQQQQQQQQPQQQGGLVFSAPALVDCHY
ncbi:zinc finger protein ZAT5 [Quillaja saponaria]|uniref:Zinc finger protein ZAT5 n=1 Tax=Quillaja saponaria TaxID=32244 RepID=A0AAD7Q539_QUISA|nr:zinc finger protein ZAT5 [Quillaja saponaria]